jgi:acyl-CoA synthetase (NDP forming)
MCEQLGLALPALDNHSAPLLRAALPEFVPASNPVDLTAQGLVDPGLYGRVLAALLGDERFGCIVLAIIQTDASTAAIKFPSIIGALQALRPQKPIIFAGLDDGAKVPKEYIDALRNMNVPYFPSPGRAYRAIAGLSAAAARASRMPAATAPRTQALFNDHGTVAEHRSKELLEEFGISFPMRRLVKTLEEAQRAAAHFGFPVVLKAQSAELPHKSDAGGVILGLTDAPMLAAGWERLHSNIARSRPGMLLDGVLVERMSRPGVELIIGGRNDKDWGPLVLAGFGGLQAEILQDVRLLAPDLTVPDIERELHLLKSAELLRGFRGAPALDVTAAATLIAKVGELLCAQPSIREIDLNPVIVYPRGQGAVALDALLILD